jgi:hypothetical protein
MITLKEYLEVIDYRITEGGDYGWDCYGSDTHALSAWNGIHGDGGWSTNVVFDTKDQTIYEIEVCDYTNDRAYRLINPEYIKAHQKEADARGINFSEAWDTVNYTDLETYEDWIEKATAIISGNEYDTRVQVPLTLDDDQLFDLMKLAHDQDLTLNELVEDILRDVITAHETGTSNPIDFPLPKKLKKKNRGQKQTA